MEDQRGELREAADLGRDRAAELIDVEARLAGEPREAANLGRDGARELSVLEDQRDELRVLEELGR